MVVKGSEQYRSVVVPYRPLRRVLVIAGVLVVLAGSVIVSYQYGYSEAQSNYRQAMEEWNQLHELTSQQAQQLEQLNQQVANTQLNSTVDAHAMEVLRKQIVTLNEQLTSAQESNNFYRQLMDQSGENKGLVIGSFKVREMDKTSRHFQYELVMQQLTKDHRMSTGKVNITIVGTIGEDLRSYSITELSDKPSGPDIPLKLRFYQTITGNLVIPEGFIPRRIEIAAQKHGAAVVTAAYDWTVSQ